MAMSCEGIVTEEENDKEVENKLTRAKPNCRMSSRRVGLNENSVKSSRHVYAAVVSRMAAFQRMNFAVGEPLAVLITPFKDKKTLNVSDSSFLCTISHSVMHVSGVWWLSVDLGLRV
jgi:hypothetical protein